MNVMPFVKKDSDKLPDSYKIFVMYLDGTSDEFEVAQHRIIKDGLLEFVTKNDIWNLVPLSSIKHLNFDKSFSQILAIREKEFKNDSKSA